MTHFPLIVGLGKFLFAAGGGRGYWKWKTELQLCLGRGESPFPPGGSRGNWKLEKINCVWELENVRFYSAVAVEMEIGKLPLGWGLGHFPFPLVGGGKWKLEKQIRDWGLENETGFGALQ